MNEQTNERSQARTHEHMNELTNERQKARMNAGDKI